MQFDNKLINPLPSTGRYRHVKQKEFVGETKLNNDIDILTTAFRQTAIIKFKIQRRT
jgi:hypothetical protein